MIIISGIHGTYVPAETIPDEPDVEQSSADDIDNPADLTGNDVYYGDVNRDDIVDLEDALIILKVSLKISSLDEEQKIIADIDDDEDVTLSDAYLALRMALKIDPLSTFALKAIQPIQIEIDGSNNSGSVITYEENLAISGKISGEEAPKSINTSYTNKDQSESTSQVTLNPDQTFHTESLPLSIGENELTITVEGVNGTIVEKTVILYRNSSEVELADNVVVFGTEDTDELDELEQIRKGIQSIQVTQETDGSEYGSYDIIVSEDNPLCTYIDDGSIKEEDIIYIPPNEYFPEGMSVLYHGKDDNCNVEGYNPVTQEVIHAETPPISALFEGDGCVAIDHFDENSSIAFAYSPDGTQMDVEEDTYYEAQTPSFMTSLGYEFPLASGEAVKKAGWQFDPKKFKISGGFEDSEGFIALNLKDAIIYDKDGDKDSRGKQKITEEQSGKMGICDSQRKRTYIR